MNPYLNFVNLVKAIVASDKYPKISHLSRLILDEIALNEFQSHPLTVRNLITQKSLASPATIHHPQALDVVAAIRVCLHIDRHRRPTFQIPQADGRRSSVHQHPLQSPCEGIPGLNSSDRPWPARPLLELQYLIFISF